jgi:hypothetical protein
MDFQRLAIESRRRRTCFWVQTMLALALLIGGITAMIVCSQASKTNDLPPDNLPPQSDPPNQKQGTCSAGLWVLILFLFLGGAIGGLVLLMQFCLRQSEQRRQLLPYFQNATSTMPYQNVPTTIER